MPRADNEWGDWDPSQYDVPPRGTWFARHLIEKPNTTDSSASDQQVAPVKPCEQTKELYFPCLREFRCWYVWARETGRHERYLENIQTLATEFKLHTPNAEVDVNLINSSIYLSEADLHNFRLDQESYQELLEQFLQDAESILGNSGRNEISGDEYIRRYYSLDKSYTLTYYPKSDKITVEKNSCLIVYRQVKEIILGKRFVRIHDATLFRKVATGRQIL